MHTSSYKISLDQLVTGLAGESLTADVLLTGLVADSRQVTPGCAFIAFPGDRADGRRYIDQAIAAGAVAVIYEAGWSFTDSPAVPCVMMKHCQQKLSEMASRFYQHPSKQLCIIGVTGTNGKTSITQFIAQALSPSKRVAVMGTMGAGIWPQLNKTGFTTPDAITVQAFLADCRDQQVAVVAMEASSHALAQGRVAAVAFDIAIFTNLTHEHLDYHQTMQQYARAKERLLKTPGLQYAVLNADDVLGQQWMRHYQHDCQVFAYSINDSDTNGCDCVRAVAVTTDAHGIECQLETPWGEGRLSLALFGLFNLSNALAALTVLNILQLDFATSMQRLAQLTTVPGRMQRFAAASKPSVIVDFSHTPDALRQALLACRQHCQGTLICVFGCGGDRDSAKRPEMAVIAEQLSDRVVVTNDNPRTEDPQQIADEICQGFSQAQKVDVILDRAMAIQFAIDHAQAGDVVLIAGKGHETEQIIGDRMLPFSDVEQVQKQLNGGVR